MQDKALIDSCLLVYLIDKNEKNKHEKAKEWFKSVKDNENFFVSIQNLREFSNVALKKSDLPAGEINEAVQIFACSFKLVFDNIEDIITANNLAGTDGKNFWDALLVATMQRHGIRNIITENTKHFEKFKAIKAINPME